MTKGDTNCYHNVIVTYLTFFDALLDENLLTSSSLVSDSKESERRRPDLLLCLPAAFLGGRPARFCLPLLMFLAFTLIKHLRRTIIYPDNTRKTNTLIISVYTLEFYHICISFLFVTCQINGFTFRMPYLNVHFHYKQEAHGP